MAKYNLVQAINELNLTYGVELEFDSLDSVAGKNALMNALRNTGRVDATFYNSVRDDQMREWQTTYDSSVPEGQELKTPILRYPDMPILQEVAKQAVINGGRATEETGIHVHVGREGGLTVADLARVAAWCYHNDRYIEKALAILPDRRNDFCKPVDRTFAEEAVKIARMKVPEEQRVNLLKKAWYQEDGLRAIRQRETDRWDCTRYTGVNFNSYFHRGTIEFRWFNGEEDPTKVKAYAQFALAIVAKALQDKQLRMPAQREFKVNTSKYDFRVLMLSLQMTGAEFKDARNHFLNNLEGSIAWKHTRPPGQRPVEIAQRHYDRQWWGNDQPLGAMTPQQSLDTLANTTLPPHTRLVNGMYINPHGEYSTLEEARRIHQLFGWMWGEISPPMHAAIYTTMHAAIYGQREEEEEEDNHVATRQ